MIPVFDPPSPTTRCGGLWGQVRCKQIQYTLHCTAPQGSQWSYSRGTNHSGSRFACFFLLYFGVSCFLTQRMLLNHPPLPSYGLFIFGRLRLIEWGPFGDSTSTGLLSVQSKDHRAAYSVPQIPHPFDCVCYTEWSRSSLSFAIYH